MDFDQIAPEIFVGAFPDSTEEVATLKEAGVTGVLNLQSDDDYEYLGVAWPAIERLYQEAGLEVRRVRIQDFDDTDLRNRLPAAVDVLDEMLRDGHTVYVHCTAGVNRAPSTVISYLLWVRGWTLQEALEHVQRCRLCQPVVEVIREATRDRE